VAAILLPVRWAEILSYGGARAPPGIRSTRCNGTRPYRNLLCFSKRGLIQSARSSDWLCATQLGAKIRGRSPWASIRENQCGGSMEKTGKWSVVTRCAMLERHWKRTEGRARPVGDRF
jgi:hypothetical protein